MKLKIAPTVEFNGLSFIPVLCENGALFCYCVNHTCAYTIADTFNDTHESKGTPTPAATGNPDEDNISRFTVLCEAWKNAKGGAMPWVKAVRAYAVIFNLRPHQVDALLNLDTEGNFK